MVEKTTGKAQDTDAMGDLYKFLMFVAIGLGLALYLQVLRNRKYWIVMETLLGVVSLLTLPFAASIIENHQSTGFNVLVLYIFRLMAVARVAQSAAIFLTKDSQDSTVAISISLTNILSRTAKLMCALHGIFHCITISKTDLKIDLATTTLLTIGDMFQLSKLTSREGSLTIGNPIGFHLSLDGLIKFLLASWVFGFPDMFIGVINPYVTPNEGQLELLRVLGTYLFGSAVLSFASLCFKNHKDAVNILKSKLVFYGPALLFGIVMYITDPAYRGIGHTTVVLGGVNVLAVNAGYAVWQYEKQKIH